MSMLSKFKDTLEGIVDRARINPLKLFGIGLASFFLPAYAQSQNTVNFHVQSVPKMTNAHSGITLTAIPGPMSTYVETDSTTGNASANLPSGTYELVIKTKGHRRYVDTLTINDNTNLDVQVPEWIPTVSTYFTDAMDLVNCLIDEYGSQGREGLPRWHDDLQPIRIFFENPPDTALTEYKAAKKSIFEKTGGTIKFREANADSDIGVRVRYMPSDSIPFHGAGWTTVDSYFPDRTPKHMTMLIANNWNVSRGTYLGELCRVLRLFANSPDIIHVMFTDGNVNSELSDDEGNALKIIYTLKRDTDTRKFKKVQDTTITGVEDLIHQIPQQTELKQNYPNPFNPSTSIFFTIPKQSHVRLQVFNVLGQLVGTLVDGSKQAGIYTVSWDAGDRPAGVYLYKISAGEFVQTKKMVLIK